MAQNSLWATFKNGLGKIVPALVDSNTVKRGKFQTAV